MIQLNSDGELFVGCKDICCFISRAELLSTLGSIITVQSTLREGKHYFSNFVTAKLKNQKFKETNISVAESGYICLYSTEETDITAFSLQLHSF